MRSESGISEPHTSTSGLWACTYGFALPYHKSCCGYDCIRAVVTPSSTSELHLLCGGCDECEDMIASDEEKAPLNHRKTRVRCGHAVKLALSI